MKTLPPGVFGQEHSRERAAHFWWPDRRSTGPVFGRRLKLALYLLGLTLAIVVFLRWLFHNPVKTPVVALALTKYALPAPPNSYALEDVQRLEAIHCSIRRGQDQQLVQTRLRTQGSPQTPLTKSADVRKWLHGRLERTKPAGPEGNTVVLYISAHGVVNENGAPCLLLEDDESPGGKHLDSGQWLPVAELLEDIKAFVEKVPKRVAEPKVLLVLDACRIDSNWNLGLLYNGFAERLKKTVSAAKAPWLVVMNSTSPREIGWTSPYLDNGGSVFGYFFAKALAGNADTDPRDKQITLHELYAFLSQRVPQWVWNHRYAHQRPMLIPAPQEVDDFPIFYVDGPANRDGQQQAPQPAGDPQIESRQQVVLEQWKKHAQLCRLQPYRFDPLEWAEFEHQLLRLDQLMLAGAAFDSQFKKTRARIDKLFDRIKQACGQPKGDLRVCSIPFATQLHGTAVPVEWQQNALVRRWGDLADRKSVNQDDIDAFLHSAPDTDRPEFVEVHFLRVLQAYLDWDGNAAMEGHATLAIQARNEAERAAAPTDERTHYWIKQAVNKGDQHRRAAEDALFVGNRKELDKAKELWKEEASKEYKLAEKQAQKIQEVYQLRDQAWAVAPWLAQWALQRMRRTQQSPDDAKDVLQVVQRLIKETRELGEDIDDTLDTPTQSGPESASYTKMRNTFNTLQRDLTSLNDWMQTRRADFANLSPKARPLQVASIPAIHELLAIPPVAAVAGEGPHEDRGRLLEAYVDFMKRNDPPDNKDHNDQASGDKNHSAEIANDALDDLAELTAFDNAYLGALTSLDNHPAAEILRRDVQKDLGPKTPPKDRDAQLGLLDEQGKRVRDQILGSKKINSVAAVVQASMKKTKGKLDGPSPNRSAEVRRGLSEADRCARAAAVLLTKGLGQKETHPDGSTRPLDPTRRLRHLDLRFEMLWQCQRAIDDFWGPRPGLRGPNDYFAEASDCYLGAAVTLSKSNDWGSDTYGTVELNDRLTKRKGAANRGVHLAPGAHGLTGSSFTPLQIEVASIDSDLPNGTAALYVEASRESADRRLVPVGDAGQQVIRRWPLEIPSASKGRLWPNHLPATEGTPAGETLNAVTLFRGHRWSNPFSIYKERDGIVANFACRNQPAHVSVLPGMQTGWVVFIVDCSNSMTHRLPEVRPKLEQLLEQLPDRRFCVGLMFYGHRARWSKKDAGLQITYSNFPGESDFPIHPDADADWASQSLKLGSNSRPLDQDLRKEIEEILEKVEPWGQTPLYLALKKALEAIQEIPADHGEPLHIVLITDGANKLIADSHAQYETGRDVMEKMVSRTENDRVETEVLGKLMDQLRKDGKRVAVHILALQMRGKAVQLEKFVDSLTEWDWIDISEMDELGCRLQQSLGIVEYCVWPRGSSERPSRADNPGWKSMAKTWTIDNDGTYNVCLKDCLQHKAAQQESTPPPAEITIEGGEWLKLYFDKAANRLVYDRDDDWDDDVNVPATGGARRRFFVGARCAWGNRESNQQSVLRFYVSVQNDDEREFSRRPKHIWAEIGLESDAPAGKNRTFYDRNFVRDMPVPVLRFNAPEWPIRAGKAKIDLWFRMEELPKDQYASFPVGQISNGEPLIVVPPIDGVTFSARSLGRQEGHHAIRVVEQHEPGSKLGTVCVEMVPTPCRAEHRDRPERNEVEHLFFYDDQKSAIRIMSSQQLKAHAIKVPSLTVLPPPF